MNCPKCGNKLYVVVQDNWSMLNAEQFDSIKAGDYYCPVCPSNKRGNTDYCYYWKSELQADKENGGFVSVGGLVTDVERLGLIKDLESSVVTITAEKDRLGLEIADLHDKYHELLGENDKLRFRLEINGAWDTAHLENKIKVLRAGLEKIKGINTHGILLRKPSDVDLCRAQGKRDAYGECAAIATTCLDKAK